MPSLVLATGDPLATLAAALLLAVVALALLAAVYHDRPAFVPARPEVPQLKPSWPLVGSLPHLLALRKRGVRFLDESLRQQREVAPGGKPYTMALPGRFFGGRIYVVNNPAYIKTVQKDVELWLKGKAVQTIIADFLGPHGIFVSDGNVWYHQRKLSSHIFSIQSFRHEIQTSVLADLHKLDALCQDSIAQRKTVALPDVFHRFTLEAFTKLGECGK